MAWNVWMCDTMTGQKLQKVPANTSSWARVLDGIGSGSSSFALTDEVASRLDMRDLTRPVARTLAMEWEGAVKYAGIIWSRSYVRDGSKLTVGHSEIRSLFQARKALADGGDGVDITRKKLTFTSMDLGTIANKIIEAGMAGPNGTLPVILETPRTGTAARTYYGYDLPDADGLLSNLTGVINGPDIDLEPQWSTNDTLEWIVRTGTTVAPEITGNSWEWNLQGVSPGVTGLTVTEDAKNQATRGWAVGAGMEQEMLLARKTTTPAGMPLLDREEAHKTTIVQSTLQAYADALVKTSSVPTEQWSLSVLADHHPSLDKIRLGDSARVHIQGDPWIPDGWTSNRIIQMGGDLTTKVKLEFQEA